MKFLSVRVDGKRVALVDRFLNRLRKRLDSIGVETKRVGVPELRLCAAGKDIRIDGKLDDATWRECPSSSAGSEHSYYQITINPAGAVVDLDRSQGRNLDWDAQAEIATAAGKGYWTVEIFLPVFKSAIDPNHQVVGKSAPSKEKPWFFNVCRQRIRNKESELSAFLPALGRGFHVLEKFARMVVD